MSYNCRLGQTYYWGISIGLLFLFLAGSCFGQQTSGTLVGTVTDSTGAITPDTTIRATNFATNVEREAKTDSAGSYNLPFLTVGDYSVTASRAGFKTQKIDHLSIQVQQTVRADFKLEVGAVNETVNVAATGAVLQTENAAVGTVIDSAKIVELPLNGRNLSNWRS